MKHPSPARQRLPARFTAICCFLVVLLALAAFFGWISSVTWLCSLWPGGIPMAPSTALFFLIFGAVVLFETQGPGTLAIHRVALVFIWMVTFLSGMLVAVSGLGRYPNMEFLGMNISGIIDGVPIGHMSPLTAICFLVVGLTLIFRNQDGKILVFAFGLTFLVFLLSLILVIGYLVGAPLLYGTGIIPPAMATSLAFSLLSFSLLIHTGQRIWPNDPVREDTAPQATAIMVLVFLLVVSTVLAAGFFYTRNLKMAFHRQIAAELAAIADLKINELQQWRKECISDAAVFFKNRNFSDLVAGYSADPSDRGLREKLQIWLQRIQEDSRYEKVYLANTQGVEQLSASGDRDPEGMVEEADFRQVLHSRKVILLGFHRDPPQHQVHMDLGVPILDGPGWRTVVGLLILQIDPQHYLDALIRKWPIPSQSAESLLVRREGADVLYLNNVRFQPDAAFSLRFPLTRTTLPAVMAIQGRQGLVRGIDYRGVPVLAVIRAVSGSPWFLITKIDRSEINRPLFHRLLWTLIFIVTLLSGAGAVIGLIWRNQRAQFYRLRYKTAQMAEDSEKRLRLIFESSKDGIMVADTQDKRFVLVNRAICRMLGYTDSELLHMSIRDIHPEKDLPGVVETFQRQARGEFSIAPDIPMRRKDGSIFYADINTTPIEFGGRPCLLGTFRDVTDRMRARARIEHLNRVLRAVRSINQLIVRAISAEELIDKACNLLVSNGSYGSALIILTDREGWPVNSREAGLQEVFSLIVGKLDQGDLPPCCLAAERMDGVCLIRGRDTFCEECAAVDSCLSTQKMSIRLHHQETVYGYLCVGVDKDIIMDAEEKQLFVELARDLAYSLHNMEMKTTVQATEQEKERLEAQLIQAQKMEAVGQLAGGIAHDFNNLLTIILGYSQLMKEAENRQGFSSKEAMKEIHEAAIRAKKLTRQLLAFSRKQMLEMQLVDINQVIHGFEKLLRRTIGEDIRMELLLTREQALVKADISQMEQILMNLAINARDAMPDGGVLVIETARVDLDESLAGGRLEAATGPQMMISVSDNGCGMPRETLGRIFEPFFTTKPVGQGTGLGLATVYGVVKQHGGNIWVYSEPGQGTTFKIYLPVVDDDLQQEPEIKNERKAPVRDLSVLVVEDEPSLKKLVCKVLRQGGYRVNEAKDEDEAIAIAKDSPEPIHLLLTDVIMPKMKGTEVFNRVREYHSGIQVLYMSGYSENVIARQGVLQEGIQFLQKPFSARALLDKVAETLGSEKVS